ncbi:hypothetical protein BG011_005022 [Mortierella polycephala]|uniref:F-box domain-containing protein n=1 Tax=Mortierella polycephala TaxID=41804 RepID=A0A9P6QDB9_9FUNG|nr:hypothetical protein BG011_005022 [Mortierella polycephala]
MFDIPELDDMVCLTLSREELVHCARVNKKWHKVVAPYLWRDIPQIMRYKQESAFRRTVLADYLQEQRHQQPLEEESRGSTQHIQVQSPCPLSSLAKYGPYIREIPSFDTLLEYLGPSRDITWPPQKLAEQTEGPTAQSKCLESSYPIETSKLKYLLARCSSKLESLTTEADIADIGDDEEYEEEVEEGLEAGAQLKDLRLLQCDDQLDSKAFWSWLWTRCHHLKRLDVCEISGIVPSLVEGMLTHMPYLDEIHLGRDGEDALHLTDNEVAALLDGSRKGWKVIEVKDTVEFWDEAKEALVRHYPTLEVLKVDGCGDFMGDDLARVLFSCPNLHTLVGIDDGSYLENTYGEIDACTLIDRDPDTDSLKTWACESSLKVLKIKIKNIPRLDVEDQFDVIAEAYPGQGRELQSRVYERLARLVNLEILWLGHYPYIVYDKHKEPREDQCDCLDMSLENGLGKLEGLKELKELNVSSMATRIGPKEVQWMTEHWPKLRAIYGLSKDDDSDGDKAVEWLQQHCRKIKTQEYDS